jgi:hypothetical protein
MKKQKPARKSRSKKSTASIVDVKRAGGLLTFVALPGTRILYLFSRLLP